MANTPRIRNDQLKEIRKIAKELDCPLTLVVRIALAEYFERYNQRSEKDNKLNNKTL